MGFSRPLETCQNFSSFGNLKLDSIWFYNFY